MSASAASLMTPAATLRISAAPVPEMNSMPGVLQQLLAKVEARRCEIKRQAIWESLKYWSLKAPAIIAAGGSGIFASISHELGLPVAILNGLLGICVVLDGIIRPGEHRNAHLRAAEGLRNLKDSIDFWWAELKNHSSEDAAAQIVGKAEKQWKQITDYLSGTLFAAAGNRIPSTK